MACRSGLPCQARGQPFEQDGPGSLVVADLCGQYLEQASDHGRLGGALIQHGDDVAQALPAVAPLLHQARSSDCGVKWGLARGLGSEAGLDSCREGVAAGLCKVP